MPEPVGARIEHNLCATSIELPVRAHSGGEAYTGRVARDRREHALLGGEQESHGRSRLAGKRCAERFEVCQQTVLEPERRTERRWGTDTDPLRINPEDLGDLVLKVEHVVEVRDHLQLSFRPPMADAAHRFYGLCALALGRVLVGEDVSGALDFLFEAAPLHEHWRPSEVARGIRVELSGRGQCFGDVEHGGQLLPVDFDRLRGLLGRLTGASCDRRDGIPDEHWRSREHSLDRG